MGENSFLRSISSCKKRNIGSYDDFGLISQGEAASCGNVVVRVRKEVERWIRKKPRRENYLTATR
jgi:hypothetical protein